MSDDNKEGAGVPVAYANPEILRPDVDTECEWTAKVQGHRDDVFSLPLYATPPAVMPAAPSDAVLSDDQIDALQEEYDCFGECDAPRLHDFARGVERTVRAALSQTMQPQADWIDGRIAGLREAAAIILKHEGETQTRDRILNFSSLIDAAPGGKQRCVVGSKCDTCTCAEEPQAASLSNASGEQQSEGMSLAPGAAEIMGNALRDGHRNTRNTPRGHS